MKVLFITQYSNIGGTSRIHALNFLPFLERSGFDCRELYMYSDSFYNIQMGVTAVNPLIRGINLFFYLGVSFVKKILIVCRAGYYDIIFIQRECFPKSIYWFLRKINPHIVYQIEDPIYEINLFRKRSFFSRLLLQYQAFLCKNMMSGASVIIAENQDIASEAEKYNKNIYTITAPLDTDYWKPGSKEARNIITLGWIGSPSTTPFLKAIAPALSAIGRKYPNVQLEVIGAAPDFFVSDIKLIKKNWSLDSEVTNAQSFDIGLSPMIIAPFTKGHLGGKITIYMSLGIPFVVTYDEITRTIISDGINGLLAKSNDDWIRQLSLLIEDKSLRREIGKNGRKFAEDNFSLQQQSRTMIDIFKKVADRRSSHTTGGPRQH